MRDFALPAHQPVAVEHPEMAVVARFKAHFTRPCDVVADHIAAAQAGNVTDLALAVFGCVILMEKQHVLNRWITFANLDSLLHESNSGSKGQYDNFLGG